MFVPFPELFLPEKEPGEAPCWQERNPQHLETEVADDTGGSQPEAADRRALPGFD